MKKYLLILVLAAGQICAAQPDFSKFPNPEFAKMIYERPWMANLNACPYELACEPGVQTKAPRGYKPFYISHYGRHGTRSGWDQDKYEVVIEALTKAKEAGILSASGDSLLQETLLVKQAHNKMDGRLTVRGQREHRAIANRMYKNFRRVFRRGSKNLRVNSSTVPRCLVSMAAFTNQLSELDYRLNIVMDCGEEIQKEISNDHGSNIRSAAALVVLTTVDGIAGYEPDGSPTTAKGAHWQSFDAGIACQTFCLAAHDLGLGTLIMGIFDEPKIKELLQIPEGESISALIAVGYADIAPNAPKRKETSELLQIID